MRGGPGGAGGDAASLTCHRRAPSGRRRGGCGASCGGRRALSPGDPAGRGGGCGTRGRGGRGGLAGGRLSLRREAAGKGEEGSRAAAGSAGAERHCGRGALRSCAPRQRGALGTAAGTARGPGAPHASPERFCRLGRGWDRQRPCRSAERGLTAPRQLSAGMHSFCITRTAGERVVLMCGRCCG